MLGTIWNNHNHLFIYVCLSSLLEDQLCECWNFDYQVHHCSFNFWKYCLAHEAPINFEWVNNNALKHESESRSLVLNSVTPWTIQSMELSRPEYWSGYSLSLLRGIILTQGLNPGLPHCRQIVYQLNYQGSLNALKRKVLVAQSWPTFSDPMDCSLPGSSVHGILQARILDRIAISFSRESSQPRDWTWVTCIARRFFTVWATREVLRCQYFTSRVKVIMFNEELWLQRNWEMIHNARRLSEFWT